MLFAASLENFFSGVWVKNKKSHFMFSSYFVLESIWKICRDIFLGGGGGGQKSSLSYNSIIKA